VHRLLRLFLIAIALATFAGCSADRPMNPSLPLPFVEAKAALRVMRTDPRPLERPVVVSGGIHDPGLAAAGIASQIRRVTTGRDQVISVSFFGANTFDACRDRLIKAVDKAFGSVGPQETVEVDVVGFSMGGLVARHAARPRNDGGRRLRIRRLFTISCPHRGARLAGLPTIDERAIDMRQGSEFLAGLDADLAGAAYDLYTYARLGDMIVGAENAAPPGYHPWWVANAPLSFAHLGAGDDPRFLADIARYLRGEPPFSTEPPANLPCQAAAPPTSPVEEGGS
jgi:surfactin synthase thioesterase subunit